MTETEICPSATENKVHKAQETVQLSISICHACPSRTMSAISTLYSA